MIVPDGFGRELLADEGEGALAWIATVPELAERYLRWWRLTEDGPAMHGYVAVVLPVRRADGTPAALKIGWPHPEGEHEALALRVWDGNGAVRLLECAEDGAALLLERLDASTSLRHVDVWTAAEVAGGLARRLAVPAPPRLRGMDELARRWVDELPAEAARLGHPLPHRILDAAVDACRALGPTAGTLMVNEDLHYENVLRGEREPWLVIDPKVLAGDLEFTVIPLLWNRYHEAGGAAAIARRADVIGAAAGLGPDLVRGWTLARAVDNWLWAARTRGDGGIPEIEVCAELARWAAGPRSFGPSRSSGSSGTM